MANVTVDSIHNDMMSQISDDYQKSEGFPTWDLERGMAFGLYQLWLKAKQIEAQLNVDNLTGKDLERFIDQRKGLSRNEATYATVTIEIVTGSGTVNAGDLFATAEDLRFAADETTVVTVGTTFTATCLEAGSVGNVPANTITQMPVTIAGIAEVTNPDPAEGGYEEETDDALRERYYEALREPATSGNIYHYKHWAKDVSGVGNVKVFPLWQGDNTVQVVIIDTDAQVPSLTLVDAVQDYIDPGSAGTGEGEAPIGAYCTVTAATALTIDVTADLILTGSRDLASIQTDAEAGITAYLKKIAFESDYVSAAKIGDILLNINGVSDYDSLTVNGVTSRVNIQPKEVAVMGTVSLSEYSE